MTIAGVIRTLALLAVPLFLSAQHAELSQIQTVYLLPMGSGFDQHLANRLTQLGPFRVVTDAQKADAIFTERLGEAFETRFEELFPPPEAEPVEAVKDDSETPEKKDDIRKDLAGQGRVLLPSSFGRGRGTIFLVDRHSRRVVWSTFEKPRNMMPETLDVSAERVVKQLKRDLGAK